MLARLHLCMFMACSALGAGDAYGQYGPPPGAYDAYNASPAAWSAQPYGAMPPPNYYGPAYPNGGADPHAVNPRLVTELLPADRGLWWSVDSALSTAIRDTAHGTWFRLEYMSTFIDSPGNTLLGAPLAGVANPRDPFLIVTPAGGLRTARVLDVSTIDFDHINGIRGTFGLPLHFGSIEGVFWGTEQTIDTVTTDEIPRTNPLQDVDVIATSVLTGGAPGGNVILYDESFKAPYTARAFGAEANFYYNLRNPRLGLRFLPVFGFRHLDYDENLAQRGTFDNNSGIGAGPILIDPLVRRIDSHVDNNVYALQTGFRSEFVHQFFTLGLEPKVGFGVNHFEATVRTSDLRDSPFPPVQDDDVVSTMVERNLSSPIFDLQLYAKVHLTQSLHLRAGWTYSWTGGISRADKNIYYNDNGTANPPAIVVRPTDESLWMSSFTVGGEYILP